MIKANYEKVLCFFAVSVVALLFAACGQQEQSTTPSADMGADLSAEVPITTSSDSARELYLQGRGLLDDLHFVEANEVFARAVAADDKFAMGYFMLAQTALTAAEGFAATGMASETAANASEGEQLYIRALVAASENDQAAQRDALTELLAMYPKDERTHMQMGNYLFGQQDFTGAIERFTNASEINPAFSGAYNMLGYSHRQLDNLDSARAAFTKYVETLPGEANPYDSLAELMMEMGDYDESIDNYRKALDIDPYFAASYQGISINQSLKGDADLAQEAADQALAAARNFPERQNALFRSVTSHLFAGDIESAMDVCDTMISEAQVKGNRAAMGGIHDYMGDIMLANDDAAKAEEHYDAALNNRQQADINDANKIQAARTHLFKTAIAAMVAEDDATAASRVAEYSAAADAHGTAFEKRRIHELKGYLAMSADDFEAGAAHLDQASQLDPTVLYWAAVANAELGNSEKAADLALRAANRNTLSGNLPLFRGDALQLLEELNAP